MTFGRREGRWIDFTFVTTHRFGHDAALAVAGCIGLSVVLTTIALGCGGSADDIAGPTSLTPTTATSSAPTPTTGPAVAFADRLPTLPAEPFSYQVSLPAHFDTAAQDYDSTPSDNPTTDDGATLGRLLFYDANFSRSRMISCASCHLQQNAFADPTPQSLGVAGFTRRNSMPLSNAVFNVDGRYRWDKKAATLETQVLQPFSDPIEMGLSLDEVVTRTNNRPFYPALFEAAFGDPQVTGERIAAALSQFIRSMVSADAPYDTERTNVDSTNEPFPGFTDRENRGKELFTSEISAGGGSCASCHATDAHLTTPRGVENNGIDAESTTDLGYFEVTGAPADLGAFRVPSLRNVEVTAPYMHDGRFLTLAEVVNHYNEAIAPHESLSEELLDPTTGTPVRLNLDDDDQAALVTFLETLTDRHFLRDERFRDPFKSAEG